MTFIDFFAGIGGFRRGMELAGHKCVGFCEWDKYAAASYISMHLITEEQRAYLATLDMKKRQKEILKDEYRNGEWYAADIRTVDARTMPVADCWCFGAPCQDFSIAGHRKGLDGDRSSLVREIFRLLEETREEDRPEWLIYENVKGMLSSNRGFDFLAILLEMERGGYDCEWFTFNSKYHGVPQNRERVYTVGHLRRCGAAKIFPLKGSDGKDSLCGINQIGHWDSDKRSNPNQYRVYGQDGLSPTLSRMDGGGREPHVPVVIDKSYAGIEGEVRTYENECPTLSARDYKEPRCVTVEIANKDYRHMHEAIHEQGGGGKHSPCKGLQGRTEDSCSVITVGNTNPSGRGMNGNCYFSEGVNPSVTCNKNEGNRVAVPVLTPDRIEKRQNGRRFKEDGDPSFTLTAQDRHGVALGVLRNTRSEYGKEIRKAYEQGEVKVSRHEFLEKEIREDGVSNTIDSVQKDNLCAVNVSSNVVKGMTEECSCLNASDQRKVFGAHQQRTMAAVKVKEATKKGYAIAHEGDSINLALPNSTTRRGRVGGGGSTDIGHSVQSGCDRDEEGEYP